MKNEKKQLPKMFSVRLPEDLIFKLEQYVKWRKKNNYTLDTVQEQVQIALENHLKKVK